MRTLTYESKQLICREVELEKMRRVEMEAKSKKTVMPDKTLKPKPITEVVSSLIHSLFQLFVYTS